MSEPAGRQLALDITVFTCGAMVMAYEIIGSRILSPFLGASTYVWTSLIGVILGSLSLGYWLGGRLADRRPDLKILAAVIFFAGGLISVTVLIKEVVLTAISSAPVGMELRSLIASLVLFAPASICLGIVTPYAVKLRISSLGHAGSTVGRLYALSTVGSIAGTFLAGFVLIPFVGSVRTLYGISAGLVMVSLLLAPFALTSARIAVLVVIALSTVYSEASFALLRASNGLHDIDTEYSRVQVFETKDPRTGRPMQALATDPYFIQSAMFLDDGAPALDYSRFYHLAAKYTPGFQKVLVIGGAGYSVPKEFLHTYPNAQIDVVEIDPMMTYIARRFFRLEDDPRLSVIHEDARTFLNRTQTAEYDVILMDAFGSLFSVPYQLTTVEAIAEMQRTLRPGGVVIFNLGSAITGEGARFLLAEAATYKTAFPNVDLYKVNADYPDDRLQNLIIAAGETSAVNLPAFSGEAGGEMLSHLYRPDLANDLPVLTDDLAPVEYYNSIAQNIYLKQKGN